MPIKTPNLSALRAGIAGARHRYRALSGPQYDSMWSELDDFIRYHPGARHRRRIIAAWLADIDFSSCVDVGCGPGELIAMIAARHAGVTITGVDLSNTLVARNRQRFPACSFAVLDIQDRALAEQFDLVVCSEVIEHLDDRARAFRHLAAMVKPGGHLLITCPTGKLFATERHFGHTSHPDLAELRHHVAESQLVIERALSWGWPLYALLKRATNLRPDLAIRGFASGDYGWSQKTVSSLLYWANFCNLSTPLGCQLFLLVGKP